MKRYENYASALKTLELANQQDLSNEFVKGGVIDKFFMQFELGWKLLKELLSYEGIAQAATGSPREIIKSAYKYYDFIDEDLWLSMLRDRNNTAHIYDGAAADVLVKQIIEIYIPEFKKLEKSIDERYATDILAGI